MCLSRVSVPEKSAYQEYERVNDHKCNPHAVKVVIEPFIQMSQSLKIPLHATPVPGTGYHRKQGK